MASKRTNNYIYKNEIELVSMSVANDIGILFTWKNRLFRAIKEDAVEKVKDMFDCGMINELMKNNLFPDSWRVHSQKSVAVKLSNIWLFITVAITNSLAPSIINAKKINNELYIERIQLLYNFLIKIAFVISMFTFFFSKNIVINLYGIEYKNSVEVLKIYIWSIIFVYMSNGSWSYYLNENLQNIAGLRLIYGAIINVILNLYFIKYFGLVGAAYSTIISYSISSYFVNFFYKKTRTNFILQTRAIFNLINLKTWLNPLKQK